MLWSAPAWSAGEAALFVAGVQPSDARAAAWVEAAWFQAMGTQVRSTELILGGVPSAKASSLQKAKRSFAAGKKAFDDLSPDSAFRNFRNAVRQLEEAIPHVRDLSLLARSWAYIGVSYLLNGKQAAGRAAFRRTLLLQANFSIKSVTKDQSKIKLFNELRQSLKKGGRAALSVTAQPRGAVYVNGRFVGLSPLKVQVPKGTHVVMVRRPGWRWWGKLVAIGGSSFSLAAKLSRRPTITAWKKAGLAAVVHTLQRNDIPTEVGAFATLTKAKKLVMARVRLLKGGKQLAIQAVVYDATTQKQLAAGGALVGWKPNAAGRATLVRLVRGLLAGTPTRLGGWTPQALSLKAPSGGGGGKKGGNGLAIGLGVGIGVLVAGGATVVLLYLLKPEVFGGTPNCGTKGGCVSVVIK